MYTLEIKSKRHTLPPVHVGEHPRWIRAGTEAKGDDDTAYLSIHLSLRTMRRSHEYIMFVALSSVPSVICFADSICLALFYWSRY